MGTGALAAADLGGVAREPHHRATEQMTHRLENNLPKNFSQCCKNSRVQPIYAISTMNEYEQSLEQLKCHQL